MIVRRTLFLPPPIGVLDVPLPRIGTTKRNNPVLTLMVGEDMEWVLWTPQGYYNTSIVGDWRYLGWHINADYRASRSADFVPMGTYAATMQKPAILEQLWRTGDLDTAIRVAGPPAGTPPLDQQARDNQPPKITFGPVAGGIRLPAPGLLWKVGVPDPQIELNITAPESSRLTARRVVIDEQPMELPPLAAPATRHSEVLRLRLTPRRGVRLAVEATSENRTSRTETMDLIYLPKEQPPAPLPPQPSTGRLIVLAIGNEQSANTSTAPSRPVRGQGREDPGRLAGRPPGLARWREVPVGREGGPPRAGRWGGLGEVDHRCPRRAEQAGAGQAAPQGRRRRGGDLLARPGTPRRLARHGRRQRARAGPRGPAGNLPRVSSPTCWAGSPTTAAG